jgi:hypothetical protein
VDAYEHFFGLCPLTPVAGDDRSERRAAHRAMLELAIEAQPANLSWSLAERRADRRRP